MYFFKCLTGVLSAKEEIMDVINFLEKKRRESRYFRCVEIYENSVFYQLQDIIEKEKAYKLFLLSYGGMTLVIPSVRRVEAYFRNIAIKNMYKSRSSYKEIAEEYSLSERHIREICKNKEAVCPK